MLRPLSGCSVIPSYVYPFGNLNDIRIVTLSANFVATRWHMIRLGELYFPTHDKQTRVTAVYSSIMRCCGVGVRTKPSCASKINNKKKFLCSDLAANNLHQNTFFLCSFLLPVARNIFRGMFTYERLAECVCVRELFSFPSAAHFPHTQVCIGDHRPLFIIVTRFSLWGVRGGGAYAGICLWLLPVVYSSPSHSELCTGCALGVPFAGC